MNVAKLVNVGPERSSDCRRATREEVYDRVNVGGGLRESCGRGRLC